MSDGISPPRRDSIPPSQHNTNINLRDLTQFNEVSSDEVLIKACPDTVQQVQPVRSNSNMVAEVCHLCATQYTDQHHQFISWIWSFIICSKRDHCLAIPKDTISGQERVENYRPVANISLISKLIEKFAIAQLQKHLTSNALDEPLHSAYPIQSQH